MINFCKTFLLRQEIVPQSLKRRARVYSLPYWAASHKGLPYKLRINSVGQAFVPKIKTVGQGLVPCRIRQAYESIGIFILISLDGDSVAILRYLVTAPTFP